MPEHASSPESLWDANDVAAFLKVSRSWVYQKVASNLIPFVRIGGLVRFVPEHVRAFAHGQPVPPAAVVPLRPRRA